MAIRVFKKILLRLASLALLLGRVGKHDHFVLSVALGCWWIARPTVERRMLKLTGW